MQTIRSFALGAVILALSFTAASAEKRVALVIGNSAYQNVARLSNPASDAAAMAATFRNANFNIVEFRTDLSAAQMRWTLRDFADKARDADIAVVYFAGHGIEVDGTNYLIPVDAVLQRDTDVYDAALALDRVLVAIESAKRLRLVILDACRDNPFAQTMTRTSALRSIDRGLAKVEPSNPNTLIAFAARAGSTALDGDSNSPFATALIKYITKPGLDLRKAFGFVRDDVLKATGNKQEPFVYGSLGGDDVSLVPAVAPAPAASGSASAVIKDDYEMAERVATKAGWDAFIGRYPSGFYTELAKAQRDKLIAERARIASTENAVANAHASIQAEAAAPPMAPEETRIAADNTRAAEKAKSAAVARANAAAPVKSADDANVAAGEASDAKPADKLAAVATMEPAAATVVRSGSPAIADIPRQLQSELRRVGCKTGAIDGSWNAAARRSLDLFNKNAGTKLDVKVASLDALAVVRAKSARVCPVVCEHGYRADGDRCTKLTCRAGFEVGDDNGCTPIALSRRWSPRESRSIGKPPRMASQLPASARPPWSGQIICLASGCRPVAKGCRLESRGYSAANEQSGQVEICD